MFSAYLLDALPSVYVHNSTVFIFPDKYGPPFPRLSEGEKLERLGTILNNLSQRGFTFSKPLMDEANKLSPTEFNRFYQVLDKILKEKVGAHQRYKPMYPNFPKQVMEASEAELFINAILHYWFGLLPEYNEEKRQPMQLPPLSSMRVLDYGTKDEFLKIPTTLLSSKSSLTESEKEEIGWFFKFFGDESVNFLPETIPFKENVAFAITTLMKNAKLDPAAVGPYFKTAKDVLRLAVAFSGGDVSLHKPTKFISFSKPQRRLLMGLLEPLANTQEDMLRNVEMWKRLGERLHPGEFKARYPKALGDFEVIRKGEKALSFNGRTEKMLANRDIEAAISHLQNRPGEFIRRLDHLLRLSTTEGEWKMVQDVLNEVAKKVATPVLLQVMAHFKGRSDKKPMRTFFPKGQVANATAIENTLPDLDDQVIWSVKGLLRLALIDRLRELYKGKPALGRVYVDPLMANFTVPLTMRTASKSLRTLSRGSKLPLPEGSTLRFFIYWREGRASKNETATGRVDIDLSAAMYDSEWEYSGDIAYYNLRGFDSYHSGDITAAPNGACEFIDVDIQGVVKAKGRYIIMAVNSFTSQPFNTLPECFAGWMMRSKPNSGQIFEPATVVDKIDLAADTKMAAPLIFDLEERVAYWADLAYNNHPGFSNNVRSNKGGLGRMGQAITTMAKPDLYDLFTLHALARGKLVQTRDEADIVFAPDGDVSPFDLEKIRAEYL
jgi:hypothetical protein